MKTFALIGAAGYVAPRHLQAMAGTNNKLVAAMDKFDSVGILDRFFPEANFFTEFERFDRFLDKRKREIAPIDFLTVCTPNYLHDSHIRFGLKHGASVICEKPLVLTPWNAEALKNVETETGKEVFNILQLRLHPDVEKLKSIANLNVNTKLDLDLTYITPRGKWYHNSWKGDIQKSGGITTNIGIHFFDLLIWIFGRVKNNIVHMHSSERAAGFLELEGARIRWFLSICSNDLPADKRENGNCSFRAVTIKHQHIEFGNEFENLHQKSYEHILTGKGFKLDEAVPSIELAYLIRNVKPAGLKGDVHPIAAKIGN